MGIYMFVSDEDRITKRKVSDKVVNEEFQEALKFDPSLMIEEYIRSKRVMSGWFKTKIIDNTRYSIYHESPSFDGSAYQARLQTSGSGDKRIVIAYLHGLINGASRVKLDNLTTNNP